MRSLVCSLTCGLQNPDFIVRSADRTKKWPKGCQAMTLEMSQLLRYGSQDLRRRLFKALVCAPGVPSDARSERPVRRTRWWRSWLA
jgi:hypothetical protein